jgi:hypothetical protein
MIGELIINGVDIYQTYKVGILEGGLKDVVSFPPLKEPDISDWAERDGIEVDLSSPKFAAKRMVVEFYQDKLGDAISFINFLSGPGYKVCNFAIAGVTRTLRVVSVPEFDNNLITVFSVEFSEDNPPIVASNPTFTNLNTGYKLNGVDLSVYGVQILEGSNASILKPFQIKQNLSVDSRFSNGVIYDVGVTKYRTKEVELKCFIKAPTLSVFWANMNALLSVLVSPGSKAFQYGLTYECYYKSMSVVDFVPKPNVWCTFSLNLVFTKLGV